MLQATVPQKKRKLFRVNNPCISWAIVAASLSLFSRYIAQMTLRLCATQNLQLRFIFVALAVYYWNPAFKAKLKGITFQKLSFYLRQVWSSS